jgi:glycosyltransferase involved in cell wall biosynthesis/GT2 family glycosyltransferase
LLTVLMATCNGAPTLPKVLAAYCRLQAPPGGWSLLIVDDGSTDDTVSLIQSFASRLPLQLLQQERRGKCAALNVAVEHVLQYSDAALFVLTDDDATPDADWLLRYHECASEQRQYALFGGTILPDWAEPPPGWIEHLVPLGLTYAITSCAEGPVFPGLVWGANMAVRRTVFEAGHRFDAGAGPNAGSYAMGGETEFNRRIAKAGFAAWFCASARVHHFIRPHQLTRRYVLQRAMRNGRGAQLQGLPDSGPLLWRVPRWMLAKLLLEFAKAARALVLGQAEAAFLHCWEVQFLRGVMAQAWHRPAAALPGPRRVLITSCSGQLGGMELRMAQEARILHDAGHRSMVATPHFQGFDDMARGLRAQRIDMTVFDPPQFFEHWAWRRSKLLLARLWSSRRLRHYRPDLVHVAFCWNDYGASVLWLAHCCKLPAVISVHATFALAEVSQWHESLYKAAFRSVRGIYAVSDSALQRFVHIYRRFIPPGTRLTVIPNCVDTKRFVPSLLMRARSRDLLGIPAHALVLGSVARLSHEKRPQALLSAFVALRRQFPQLYLVFAGTGPMETALRQQANEAGASHYVLFTGHHAAVEELLPALDLHILLSRSEGFGIATIEAMACGVPAVGADVPGIADILRGSEGGILVPGDDEQAIVAALAALLLDPGRRAQMGAFARAEVRRSYTPALLEQRLLQFYGGLLP